MAPRIDHDACTMPVQCKHTPSQGVRCTCRAMCSVCVLCSCARFHWVPRRCPAMLLRAAGETRHWTLHIHCISFRCPLPRLLTRAPRHGAGACLRGADVHVTALPTSIQTFTRTGRTSVVEPAKSTSACCCPQLACLDSCINRLKRNSLNVCAASTACMLSRSITCS